MGSNLNGEVRGSLIAELAPGWRASFLQLGEDAEHFLCQRKIILIDEDVEDREHAVAHAAAHVRLEHHRSPGEDFTADQEDQANWLAAVWLDRLTEAS